MAARKKPTGVSNTDIGNEETSTTLDHDSSPSLTKREAAKQRHVSLKQCAILLNRDRNTIMKWLDHGMPAVEKADRERGVPPLREEDLLRRRVAVTCLPTHVPKGIDIAPEI